jgi:hypothetical protein
VKPILPLSSSQASGSKRETRIQDITLNMSHSINSAHSMSGTALELEENKQIFVLPPGKGNGKRNDSIC